MEDAVHLLDECTWWKGERRRLWALLEEATPGIRGAAFTWSRVARVRWILRGGNSRTRAVVLKEVGKWYWERQKAGRDKVGAVHRRYRQAHADIIAAAVTAATSAAIAAAPRRRPIRLFMRRRARC